MRRHSAKDTRHRTPPRKDRRASVRRVRDGRSVICTRAPVAYATDALSYAQERSSRTRRTLGHMHKSARRCRDGRSVISTRAPVAAATDALPYVQERPSHTRPTLCHMHKSARRCRDGRSAVCSRASVAYATDALWSMRAIMPASDEPGPYARCPLRDRRSRVHVRNAATGQTMSRIEMSTIHRLRERKSLRVRPK